MARSHRLRCAIDGALVTMFWFYVSGLALLVGAELDGVLEDRTLCQRLSDGLRLGPPRFLSQLSGVHRMAPTARVPIAGTQDVPAESSEPVISGSPLFLPTLGRPRDG